VSGGTSVRTTVGVPIGSTYFDVISRLSFQRLNSAFTTLDFPSGSPDAFSPPTLSDVAVPCGLPSHQCSSAPPIPVYERDPTALSGNTSLRAPRSESVGVDLGPCVCDLLASACDGNCNCDPDCGASARSAFTEQFGVAMARESAANPLPICLPEDSFLKINSPLRLESSPLCVVRSNNPSLGRYFTSPGPSVDNNKVRVEFESAGSQSLVEPAMQSLGGQTYQVGMRIPTAVGVEAKPTLFSDGGFLSLPGPGPGGRCVQGGFAAYWREPDPAASATVADGSADVSGWGGAAIGGRPSASAAAMPSTAGGDGLAECVGGGPLSPARYVSNLFIASGKPSLPADLYLVWADISQWILLNATYYVQPNPLARPGEPGVLMPSGVAPEVLFNGTACLNAVRSIAISLVIDPAGGLASAQALVTLTHLPASAPATSSSSATSDAANFEVWTRQKFTLSFLAPSQNISSSSAVAAATADAISTAISDPLLLRRRRSGRPGYLPAEPVLSGLQAASAATTNYSLAVLRRLMGLSLPRMAGPGGLCRICPTPTLDCASSATSTAASSLTAQTTGSAPTSASGDMTQDTVPVLFGEDLTLGCTLQLTRAQLQNWCTSQTLHPLLQTPDFYLSGQQLLRIGIWGDSDPTNPYDWLPPPASTQTQLTDTLDNPAAGQSWDPRGRCSIVDTVEYQILTVDVGNVLNPQRKILGARVRYLSRDWLAPAPDKSLTSGYYPITARVTFLKMKDGGSVEVIPPPPSFLPLLPDDLFYPFVPDSFSFGRRLLPVGWRARGVGIASCLPIELIAIGLLVSLFAADLA